MVLQREVEFTEYFRCFVVGREKVLIHVPTILDDRTRSAMCWTRRR